MLYFARRRRAKPRQAPGNLEIDAEYRRKILIVDDDDELRDALVEQLSLYEEFEARWPPTPAPRACRPPRPGRSIW